MNKYIHTIEGMVGSYYPGQQICFHRNGHELVFCDSLRQIRREQRASLKWRQKQGFRTFSEYGYIRVKVKP